MSEVLIRVEDLNIGFRDRRTGENQTVVRGVSFELRAGRTLAIVGESGSGKSVSARSLLGLVGPRSQVRARRLEILGVDARGNSEADWRRVRGRQIGMVLQDALVSLDPLRRVGAEITEAMAIHTDDTAAERLERARDLLSFVGIPDPDVRLRQYPHELSGGLRQRALIAAATALSPRVLIADEPTTALDTTVQAQVIELLKRLKQSGDGLIFISHDLAVVSSIADDIIVMKDGRVVEAGPAHEVLTDPQEKYTRQLLHANPANRPRGVRLTDLATGSPSEVPARVSPAVRGRPVVEANRIVKTYRSGQQQRRAVDDVSFTLHERRTLGIVGESGSGKTTLARIVLGLTTPDSGNVLLEAEQWNPLKERERRARRNRMQMIAQDPFGSFDPRYSVRRIVAEAVPAGTRRRRGVEDRVVELLEEVGLTSQLLDRRPDELSGGQRQRVAIARALAPEAPLIVCDEPVTALDVTIQAQVLDLLNKLQQELGLTLLFISHDLGVIRHMSDDLLVMKDGKVVESGCTEEVFERPRSPYTQRLLASLPELPTAVSG